MLKIHRHCWRITAIITGAVAMALPAVAMDPEYALKLCGDYLLNHFGEARYEAACSAAMQELESQQGSVFHASQSYQTATASSEVALTVGSNVNMSQFGGNHLEVSISINPTDPDNLFAFSNTEAAGGGLFAAYSIDGGTTWTNLDTTADGEIADGDAGDLLPLACCDPSSTWDEFGNLFISYLEQSGKTAVGSSPDKTDTGLGGS